MTNPDLPASGARGDRFAFGPISRQGAAVRFTFECSVFGSFTEEVQFESDADVPEALLRLLQVALGVSTYKAAAARTVALPPLGSGGRAMAEALYTDGLAEFFVRSKLPFPAEVAFEGEVRASSGNQVRNAEGVPLVAFGGGKDSYVAGEIVERATGQPPQFASVVLAEPVAEVLRRTAPSEPLIIRRSLDPKLLELKGGYTGHVPITAINILVLTIEGLLRGSGPVLFANERSADEPTMAVGGAAANHQYSKSSAFEALVRAAVAEAAPEAPPTYSVLRPFSELWIGRAFAKLPHAFPRFTSCNRNFRLAGDADQRWCGACAKCAFTSLILSPYLSAHEVETIFGRNMLDRPNLLPIYEELCGLSEQKPWDCVGTIAECQAALFLASKRVPASESLAVRELTPRLLKEKAPDELRQQAKDALLPDPRGDLPAELYDAAMSL